MGIEAIGSGVASAASAVGKGVSSVGRVSAEAGSSIGAVSGIGKLSAFGASMEAPLSSFVKEGPVGLPDLQASVPLGEIKFNEPLSVSDVLAEAESILSQAQKPAINSVPLLSLREADEIGPKQSRLEYNPTQIAASPASPDPRNDELIEPMIRPFVVPTASPALEPAVQADPQTESGVANEVEPATEVQSVLQEQEVKEVATKRVAAKQIDIGEEEKEEVRLKNVVDEKVLETRIAEFDSAADIAGAAAKEEVLPACNASRSEAGGEEIRGSEIVGHVPVETEEKRSGLVKKQGPDGSREETIEEVASRKFKSIKEAREEIAAIIFNKPPVKKEKEGEEVGQEAVARVLKYRMVKSGPEAYAEVVKRENTLEGLGLSEIFPKAA